MVPIRKKQLHYRNCFRWWEQRESNPRPSACKADALNQLSYAPVFRSLPGGNSLSPHLSSLHCEKTNFKTVSFKELPFKRGFSERDCKGR